MRATFMRSQNFCHPKGDDFQYKIRSAAEPHKRVVKGNQLNRAA
jgi:hypothetical protein